MRAVVYSLALASVGLALSVCGPATAGPPAVAPAAAMPAAQPPPVFTASEYVIGDPHAKVSVVEYASVACPHCARFDAEVFPALKAKYIDTGKVRFALREMLVGDEGMVEVAAAGFLLARCAGKEHYFQVVEAIYRAQPEIFKGGDLKGVLTRIARANGLDAQQLDACVDDKGSVAALNARVEQAEKVDHIDGTPTFLIDNRKLDEHGHDPDIALFDAALKPLLAHRR